MKQVSMTVSLPKNLVDEFSKIAVYQGFRPSDLISKLIKEFVDTSGIKPPPAEVIISKLQKNKHKFKKVKLTQLSLFGSIVRGEIKQGSEIDLIADFNGPVGQFKWVEAKIIAENIIGLEYKVDLVPISVT